MWLCLKMGSENMVLVRLLQIGAKDPTVQGVPTEVFLITLVLILLGLGNMSLYTLLDFKG